VTADHGEEFGEHGMTRHGFEVWETLTHVPLMIIAPGAAPRHIAVPRSAIDLAPTILEFLGVPSDPSFEGKSLVAEIYGSLAAERDVIIDLPATSDSAKRRALIRGSDKLICFDTDKYCKLFDLQRDPMESSPIAKGSEYAEMKSRYDAFTKTIKEVAPYACGATCLNGAYRTKEQN